MKQPFLHDSTASLPGVAVREAAAVYPTARFFTVLPVPARGNRPAYSRMVVYCYPEAGESSGRNIVKDVINSASTKTIYNRKGEETFLL